ncbi:MAG: phospholipase A [Epsilonproteobacteria bacterium]|nr:phospholipase A [Campylobacterota bacterium]
MKKILSLAIIAYFNLSLFAQNASTLYEKAQKFENKGNFKQAMLLYKEAASLALKPKKLEQFLKEDNKNIIKYGNNDIKSYKNASTNKSLKQIIFQTFDVKPYHMNYLLPFTYDDVNHNGRKNMETKFQISFKKSLAKNLFGMQNELFLGYSQTSWWQTSAASSPFRETNYEPELFMLFPYAKKQSILKAYKVGILHQSNGQGGSLSRSWNRIYLEGALQKSGIFMIPRIWYRIPEHKKVNPSDSSGDDNPDIYKYLGYGDLKILYPYKKQLFSILLRDNFRFKGDNKGAVQFDWTFPFPWGSNFFGYLQIFSGYGESLIDYNKRNDKIGLGFAITR